MQKGTAGRKKWVLEEQVLGELLKGNLTNFKGREERPEPKFKRKNIRNFKKNLP